MHHDSVKPGHPALEWVALERLKPQLRNARTHSRRQIQKLVRSIKDFGFTSPILVDADYNILAGHGRLEAAKLAKLTEVPVIRLDRLTEAQKKAYAVADNRLAELAGWDRKILALEFQEILRIETDIDLTSTGFEIGEIDLIIGSQNDTDPDEADELPEVLGPLVSRRGDLWRLGRHYLLCGDATDQGSFQRLLGDQRARMVITDPPFNVAINGHVSGLGKARHAEFAMASGEMSEEQFTRFLQSVTQNLADFSADGSLHYICMDWRHMRELLAAGHAAYDELKNLCVWAKTNAGMGSFYRSQHELVFVFKKGRAAHLNNIELGRFGRHRSNVWTYAGANTFSRTREQDLANHPTVKPVQLVADAIQDASAHGDIVLDAFGGSGTTLLAAEKTGRRAYLLELEPRYVDVTIERYQKLTGKPAVLVDLDITYDEMKRACAKEKLHG